MLVREEDSNDVAEPDSFGSPPEGKGRKRRAGEKKRGRKGSQSGKEEARERIHRKRTKADKPEPLEAKSRVRVNLVRLDAVRVGETPTYSHQRRSRPDSQLFLRLSTCSLSLERTKQRRSKEDSPFVDCSAAPRAAA